MRCLRTPILIIFEFCIAVRKWDYVRLLFGEDARLCLTHFLNSPGRYFRVPLPRLSKSRLDVMDIAKMWPIDTHRRKIESLLLFAGVHIQMRSCCGHWLQFLTDRGCCSLALTWPHGCFKMFSGQTCATMAVFSWGQTTGRSDCHNTRWCQALISEHHWDKHVMFKHVQTILVNFNQTICQIVAERCRTQLNATDEVTILQTVESSEVKSLLLRFLEQLEVSSDRSLKAHSNIMRALSEHRMSISWVLCHLCCYVYSTVHLILSLDCIVEVVVTWLTKTDLQEIQKEHPTATGLQWQWRSATQCETVESHWLKRASNAEISLLRLRRETLEMGKVLQMLRNQSVTLAESTLLRFLGAWSTIWCAFRDTQCLCQSVKPTNQYPEWWQVCMLDEVDLILPHPQSLITWLFQRGFVCRLYDWTLHRFAALELPSCGGILSSPNSTFQLDPRVLLLDLKTSEDYTSWFNLIHIWFCFHELCKDSECVGLHVHHVPLFLSVRYLCHASNLIGLIHHAPERWRPNLRHLCSESTRGCNLCISDYHLIISMISVSFCIRSKNFPFAFNAIAKLTICEEKTV